MEAREIINNMIEEERFTEEDYWHHAGNFLDRFRYAPKEEDLQLEPIYDERVWKYAYAFVAATIEKLANENNFKIPAWCNKQLYHPENPYFLCNATDDFRIILIHTTPEEFMNHNLFVLDTVLTRC